MRTAILVLVIAMSIGCVESNHRYGPFVTGPFGVPSAPVACGSDADCQRMAKGSLDPGWVCRFLYGGYPPAGGLERAVCTPPPAGWVADSDPSYPPLPGMR